MEEEMFDYSKMRQAVVSALGALVLTATAVGAAVGPARAVETAPVSLVAADFSGHVAA
jgi:hypothetical protein